MIQGLKTAFTGEEIIRSLDARIEAKRAAIEFRRDEIRGTVQPVGDNVWQVSAEDVEDEIDDIEHSIMMLTLIRDRLLPGETYLLGRKELGQAGLMPQRPERVRALDPEKEMRWVTRATG
jgi:hypothetical protein